MPALRAYSFLHDEPVYPGAMLHRYLGIESLSVGSVPYPTGDVGIPQNKMTEDEIGSVTTSEFFGDMDEHSTIQSIYEECGNLIEEGFPVPSESEDYDDLEETDDWDTLSPQTSRPHTPTSPPATPAVYTSAVERVLASHSEAELPLSPLTLQNLTTRPVPDHVTCDLSPEGYHHLDPTRPNPHIHYLCLWEPECFSRIRGASPGHVQYHLRRMHQVNDSITQSVRCEYHLSCQEDRICGEEVPVKDIGRHVCDVHWRSRVVQCPFCGAFQTHRGDVPQHWVESCAPFASASEDERRAWRRYWRWPAKNWSRKC